MSALKAIGEQNGTTVNALSGIYAITKATAPHSKPIWGTALIWIFMIGMAAVFAKTIITWIRLITLIRKGEKICSKSCTIVITDDEKYAPFSWMRFVVISRKDFTDGCSAIATHEFKHVASRHWLDLLIAQAACIVCWYNPAAWLMRDELMLVHEYQADMAVIDCGHDPQEYQMLLIKKAVGARFPSLANSLNHSKLKKRITMMYKKKSSAGSKLKALALVPMLALAIGVASVPTVKAAVSAISNSDVTIGKGSEKSPNAKVNDGKFKLVALDMLGDKCRVKIFGENLGNSLTVSGGKIITDGNTYEASSMQCSMTDGKATITAVFPAVPDYKDALISINVNGEDMLLTFEGLDKVTSFGNDLPEEFSTLAITDTVPGLSANITIYFDGKEITREEMEKIPAEKIQSIDIDKRKGVMSIALKK